MPRLKRKRRVKRRRPAITCLTGNSIHKIKADVIKTRRTGMLEGFHKLLSCVKAPQCLQFFVIKALRTYADAIYAFLS